MPHGLLRRPGRQRADAPPPLRAAGARGQLSALVCLHGFLDTPRTWGLVLGALQRAGHEVLAPALDGDPVEDAARAMDSAGLQAAHLVGNSLGGYVALKLAERGRALSVVALAPAGGWARGDESWRATLALQAQLHESAKALAPHADALVATPEGRRRATALITVRYEHIPAGLLADQLRAIAAWTSAPALIERASREGWPLEPERIACPVRIVWGTEDQLLPWPSAAARYREQWLPHADWVVLDGVGHCPQLDVPLETAQLILGFAR